MLCVTISREVYNAMIVDYPEYMENDWYGFRRDWHIGGVTAMCMCPNAIAELRKRVQAVKDKRGF